MTKQVVVLAFVIAILCLPVDGAFSVEVNKFKKGAAVPCPTRSPFTERGLDEYLDIDIDAAVLDLKLNAQIDSEGYNSVETVGGDVKNEILTEIAKTDMIEERREEAARFWFKQGLIEHLFAHSARLGMDLMALAAPSKLLVRAFELQTDEIRHADIAFDIAALFSSNYSFRGTGPFVRSHIDIDPDYEKLSEMTAINGAIAETMSSVIMKFRAELLGDEMPFLKDVLLGLSRDEGRHASLGWDVLGWIRRSHPELTVFSNGWWANRVDGPVCVNESVSSSFGFSGLSGDVDRYLRYYTYTNLIERLSQQFLSDEGSANISDEIGSFVSGIGLDVVAKC